MTNVVNEVNPQLTDPVKLYLRRTIELRCAYEAYKKISTEHESSWRDLSKESQDWLANLDHHEYRELLKLFEIL